MSATSSASPRAAMSEWPWAQPAWERTTGAIDDLHHGLLITGASGVAKREFALALSQLLLCGGGENAGQACGNCRNCTLFNAGTHPDFHLLTTELEWRDGRVELMAKYCDRYQDIGAREKRTNPARVIQVDQVRSLIERFSVHAHMAARKIALIAPADRMNANAANALLKLLEEPPADSILILLSALPGSLPATVRSRCLQIAIPSPTESAASEWLRQRIPPEAVAPTLGLCNGGPLDSLKMYEDELLPLQAKFLQGIAELAAGRRGALEWAAGFARQDFLSLLDWLHRFSCDLIRAVCGVGTSPHPGQHLPSAERAFALYDRIGSYRKIAREPFNEQLAMEELALALQHTLRA